MSGPTPLPPRSPWAASPADILLRFLLGVRPAAPGFSRVLIQPQLGPLASARGTLPTVRGPVAVAVNQTAGSGAGVGPSSLSMAFSVPGSSAARVCVPLSACGAGGVVLVDGVPQQGEVDGAYACVDPVGAGEHTAVCGSA